MKPAAQESSKLQAYVGTLLLSVLLTEQLRTTLEASMLTHMLLQFPLLIVAGVLLGQDVPAAALIRLGAWNAHGIAGLSLFVVVLGLAMVPRLLDLVLVDARLEAIKVAALVLCGVALRFSWAQAGAVLQGFFLGNALPMMAITGWLYETSPARVCNAYRLDEQQVLGQLLGWIAAIIAAAWCCSLYWRNQEFKAITSQDATPFPELRHQGLHHE